MMILAMSLTNRVVRDERFREHTQVNLWCKKSDALVVGQTAQQAAACPSSISFPIFQRTHVLLLFHHCIQRPRNPASMSVITETEKKTGSKKASDDVKNEILSFLKANENNRTRTLKHFMSEPYNLSSLFVKKTMGKVGKVTRVVDAAELAAAKQKFQKQVRKFIVTRLPLSEQLIAECYSHFKQTGAKRKYVRSALFHISGDLEKLDKSAGSHLKNLIRKVTAATAVAAAAAPPAPAVKETRSPAKPTKPSKKPLTESAKSLPAITVANVAASKLSVAAPVVNGHSSRTEAKTERPKSALKKHPPAAPDTSKVRGPKNVSFGGSGAGSTTPVVPKKVAVKTPIKVKNKNSPLPVSSSPGVAIASPLPAVTKQSPASGQKPDPFPKHIDTPRPKVVPTKSGKTPEFKVPAAKGPPMQGLQLLSTATPDKPVTPIVAASSVKSPPAVSKSPSPVKSPVAIKKETTVTKGVLSASPVKVQHPAFVRKSASMENSAVGISSVQSPAVASSKSPVIIKSEPVIASAGALSPGQPVRLSVSGVPGKRKSTDSGLVVSPAKKTASPVASPVKKQLSPVQKERPTSLLQKVKSPSVEKAATTKVSSPVNGDVKMEITAATSPADKKTLHSSPSMLAAISVKTVKNDDQPNALTLNEKSDKLDQVAEKGAEKAADAAAGPAKKRQSILKGSRKSLTSSSSSSSPTSLGAESGIPEKRVSWGKNDIRSSDLIQFTPLKSKGKLTKACSMDLMSFTPTQSSATDEDVPALVPIQAAVKQRPAARQIAKISPRITRSVRKKQQQ